MGETVNVNHQKTMTENCTFVKTCLMFTVILYHSCVFWTGKWFVLPVASPAVPLAYFARWINSFHVYAFVLVSGYLFAFLKWNLEKYGDYKSFVLGKFKRLIVPYIFVSIAWAIPIGQLFYHHSFSTLMKQYGLATAPSQLWFLIMLFWCFLVAWPLNKRIWQSGLFSLWVSLCAYGIGFIGGIKFENYFSIWTACQYFPFFVLGMNLHLGRLKWITEIKSLYLLVADIAVFIAWRILLIGESPIIKLATAGVEFLLHIIGAIMAFYILQRIAMKVKWKEWHFLKQLSESSMPMYLFHQQIIYLVIFVLNGKINPFIHAALNLTISMLGSFLISYIFKKWKITRFLIGEK